ncbi:hypothetical protein B0H16DRAFT_1474170 [Mycena metata]|uniref:Uncharacterized protein n=1 Tax=Mycena metata TaxID=1033252 RepID=A0AAD7HIN2_9AGAR|nr:hypothetical protein B0H16DRAFT_1474170 [Mycena metata]
MSLILLELGNQVRKLQAIKPGSNPAQLPRTLERPTSIPYALDLSRQILDALAPDLAQGPLPFIHHQLAAHADQMLADIHSLPIPNTIPGMRLRHAVAAKIKLPIASRDVEHVHIYPTHILAVSTSSRSTAAGPDAPLSLVAIHDVAFAASCSTPALRPVERDANFTLGTLTLPLCPIALPSMQALLILRVYMYTHRIDILLSVIFPLPAPLTYAEVKSALVSSATKLRLATHLVSAHPGPAHILGYARRVQEVWKTVCCLGMYHIELWDALDLAWALVLVALTSSGMHWTLHETW